MTSRVAQFINSPHHGIIPPWRLVNPKERRGLGIDTLIRRRIVAQLLTVYGNREIDLRFGEVDEATVFRMPRCRCKGEDYPLPQ